MVDPKIFLMSDTIITLSLAVMFFSMRLMDKRIKGTLWGGISLTALAIHFTTIGYRAESLNSGIEAISWTLSYVFGAAMFVGIAQVYDQNIPKRIILALLGLQICLVIYGTYMDMSHYYWEIVCRIPAAMLLIGSSFLIIRAKANRFIDLALGFSLTFLAALFMGRGIWFADIFSSSLATENPDFVVYSILSVVATVLAAGITALTFILSAVLANLSRARKKSAIDNLSGLLIRNEFEDQALALFSDVTKQDISISVIMADLDHFKQINDTYGHQAGDEVIAAFGTLLNDARGDQDIVGRIGGEEFVIISIGQGSEVAQKFAERLRSALQAMNFAFFPNREGVTGSFGVVERQQDEPFRSVMERVDKALYYAKQSGRNKVCGVEKNLLDRTNRVPENKPKSHLRLVS